jgi:hypothetical protein
MKKMAKSQIQAEADNQICAVKIAVGCKDSPEKDQWA